MNGIVFVTNYSYLYGANRSMLLLINSLVSLNFKIYVITREKGPLVEELYDLGVSVVVTRFGLDVYKGKKNAFRRVYQYVINYFKNALIIEESLTLIDWSIMTHVVSNSIVFNFGKILANKKKIKHIQFVREFGDLDYNVFHYWPKQLTRRIQHSDKVIFISEAVKKYYTRKYLKDDSGKGIIFVKYDAVFTHLPRQKTVIPLEGEVFNIGIFGIISKTKGQRTAILAFYSFVQLNPNSMLHIIGDGDISELVQIIEKLNISEKVKFHGYVKDIELIMESLFVCLVCSSCEALGRTTIEAMAHGKIVIGNNTCGTSELIIDGYNGLLYNETPNELCHQLNRIRRFDKAQINTISKNAREFVKINFLEESYREFFLNKIL